MEKLFQEFDKVGIDQWVDKIHADLKGKSEQLLVSEPEKDIRIKAFYHNDEASQGSFSIDRSSTGWLNRRFYGQATNKLILNELNEGIDGLGLVFKDQSSFDELTAGVQFEHIQADVKFYDTYAAGAFLGHQSIILNLDLIALGLGKGTWNHESGDFLKFYEGNSDNPTIWVTGSIYGDAGASTVQELAFACNHLNEYIQLLVDSGKTLAEINEKITIELSVNEDFFVNVAKFKVLRQMVDLIFSAYDSSYQPKEIRVFAKTSPRYLTLNDNNNNLLRQTTQAMSAIIGGCNSISIPTRNSGNWDQDEIHERMAKNIPLVLKEESYLDKVTDAAEGSYYVEHLCTQLASQAWNLFKEIEKEGGLMIAAEKNLIQDKIESHRKHLIDQMNSKEKTILGVNKYPSTLEDWKETKEPFTEEGTSFKALNEFFIEDYYKKEVHEPSKL